MRRPLLAVLLLAASVSAVRAQPRMCVANPELDAKSFALWITAKTNPDETPCAAMLAQTSCAGSGGVETRTFASADGRYTALYRIAPDGAVTITLNLSGAAGIGRSTTVLATYPFVRALYRGVGVDGLQVFDELAQSTKGIGNVMLIPADALTENGQKMCPAN